MPDDARPDGRSRPPHLRSWRDGWRHLRFLLLFSPRWLFFLPGLVVGVAGLVIGAVVATGPLTIGSVTFDVDTLVAASAMVVIGFQAVLFWLFTQVYAGAEGFLPEEPKVQRLLGNLSLERGLLAGAAIGLAGLVGLIFSLTYWQANKFGQLNYDARAAADGPVGDRARRELPAGPRHVLPVHPGHQADQAYADRRRGEA